MFRRSNDFNTTDIDSTINELMKVKLAAPNVEKLSDLSRQEARRLQERWP